MLLQDLTAKRRCFHFMLTLTLWAGTPALAAAQDGDTLPPPQGDVILEVHGAIGHTNVGDAAHFDRAMLKSLPPAHVDTHTSVTDGVHGFDGFLMRDLLERVDAQGSTVIATALNDYVIEFPIDEFYKFDVVVAYKMDGERLLPSGKGPLWIVYPRDEHEVLQDIRYDYRWVWQLIRLDIQ